MLKRFSLTQAAREVCYSAIQLAEDGASPQVQVLRVGKFSHPKYGEFEITPLILSEMLANFNAGIRGVDIAFDYFHESDKAASGWPKKLEMRNNNTELWASVVDWTPRASTMLAEKEVRYFSPDFAFRWKNPETGKTYNNVLFGGGLTNRPFVKDMAAIVAAEGDYEMDEKLKAELEAKILKLSEDNAGLAKKLEEAAPVVSEVDGLKKTIAELQAKLDAALAENAKSMAEKKAADEAKVLAEKETEFTVLLSEGKACAAQKEPFMKGDMKGFLAAAQPINLENKGNGKEPISADKEDRVLKLAEEKRKADPKLSHGDSISLALKEVK